MNPTPQRRTRATRGVWGVAAAALASAVLAPAAQADLLSSALDSVKSTVPITQKVTPALLDLARDDAVVDVIITAPPGVDSARVKAAVAEAGGEVTGELPFVRGVTARMTAPAALGLAKLSLTSTVTIDGPVKPAGIKADLTKLKTTFNNTSDTQNVWSTLTGENVGVAVVDTGIYGAHPDLKVSDADPTSRVLVSAVANAGASSARDDIGHGTHIAGLIAGNSSARSTNDKLHGLYMGAAPEAKLVSVKVADDGGLLTVSDVINGIAFSVLHRDEYNIKVINLSLSSSVAQSYKIDPLDAAVERAWLSGIAVVAAAGNRGASEDAVHYAPGNDPYVITVGGMDEKGTGDVKDDVVATWSSRGKTQDGFSKPEVNAPGARLVSTLSPGSAYQKGCGGCVVDDNYLRIGGTSMAAGVMSGAVAQVIQANPTWTPNQIKGALIWSQSSGQVDLDKALTARDPKANEGLVPNNDVQAELNAGADPSKASWSASWSKASWSTANDLLKASWSKASWSCAECLGIGTGADPAKASWSASWSSATTR